MFVCIASYINEIFLSPNHFKALKVLLTFEVQIDISSASERKSTTGHLFVFLKSYDWSCDLLSMTLTLTDIWTSVCV